MSLLFVRSSTFTMKASKVLGDLSLVGETLLPPYTTNRGIANDVGSNISFEKSVASSRIQRDLHYFIKCPLCEVCSATVITCVSLKLSNVRAMKFERRVTDPFRFFTES